MKSNTNINPNDFEYHIPVSDDITSDPIIKTNTDNTINNIINQPEELVMNNTNTMYTNTKIMYNLIDDVDLFVRTSNILHANDILNCLLVKNSLRPAYMIQTIDTYRKSRNIITDLYNIHKYFGFNTQYVSQGILISSRPVSEDMNDNEKLGQILGYPCYKDFKYHVDKTNHKTTQVIFGCTLFVKILITCLPINSVITERSTDVVHVVTITPDDVDIMSNIVLESNVNKFHNEMQSIIHYIKLLDSALKVDPRTAPIRLESRIDIKLIYCIKEQIGNMYCIFYKVPSLWGESKR